MNYYGINKRNTIGKKLFSGSVYDANVETLIKGLEYAGTTTLLGYINARQCSIMEYNGRKGKGVVFLSPSLNPYTHKPSTRYMEMDYYIAPETKQIKDMGVFPK